MTVGLPDSPDGYATDPWGSFVRVGTALLIRVGTDGSYRVTADVPSDLLGPVNTTASAEASNNLICDRTGFRIRVSEGLKEEWTGAKVRADSWEPRQSLDFARPTARDQRKGSPRPEQKDVFRNTPVTLNDLDP